MGLILLLSSSLMLYGCVLADDDDDRDHDDDDLSDRPEPPENPGCYGPVPGQTSIVTVSGQVIDYATGEPIAGAEVSINTA